VFILTGVRCNWEIESPYSHGLFIIKTDDTQPRGNGFEPWHHKIGKECKDCKSIR
jgi:hypothetical protein